ncbi:MAG: hypothetical protein Q7J57_05890 [Gemmobacter sp.]|nr:hypothetical protein [Gemmobacter sp.]
MTDYQAHVRRHRRLAILRHLEASSEYTSNASILTDVLRGVGVQSTRSQVVTELAWLTENGLITTFGDGDFVIATVTVHGAEIALGVAHHPEIQRPSPRA